MTYRKWKGQNRVDPSEMMWGKTRWGSVTFENTLASLCSRWIGLWWQRYSCDFILTSAASWREKSHKLTFKIFILFYLTGISLLLLVVHFEEASCSNWSLKSGNVRVREKLSLISKILWEEAFSWAPWLMWFAPAGRAAKLPRNVTSGISHRNEPQTAGRELWATGKPWNTRYAGDFPTAGLPNWKPEYGGIKKAPSRVESVDFYCNLYGTKVCNMFSGSLWHKNQVVQSGKGDWKGHFSQNWYISHCAATWSVPTLVTKCRWTSSSSFLLCWTLGELIHSTHFPPTKWK